MSLPKGYKSKLQKVGVFGCNVWISLPSGPGHFEQKKVVLYMDFAGLAEHMGWRAHTSKSGKSKFVQGLVMVEKI